MQLENEFHDALAAICGRYEIAARQIEGGKVHVMPRRVCGGACGDVHDRPVNVETHEDRHLARTVFERDVEDFVKRQVRPAWMCRLPALRIERAVDFVMEDKRQPGQAEHEQEQGRDEARPFMDPAPRPDGSCLHHLAPGS